ncbi:cupin domain-containing protein [Halioxenophilus sp. WMMB6]|uniref:cupin domain-containing protein n=1 Tax=Halioxenophilus sp. WMMB6 TaxID=3073815 RepID=UPI00295F1898|nr:cupin domain-containing protein [Halioxenophilus sp. WMMB6]
MSSPLRVLGDLPVATFLKEYWQKKPLLVRGALPPEALAITGDQLAGFALEDDVESRLITDNRGSWQLEHGPFSDKRFAKLPEKGWTLLVQAVDQLDWHVHKLLSQFNFLPNWRLDDIMISYAADQGSVGPHLDQYDVFLIQGEGTRRWQISPDYNDQSPHLSDTPLSILSDFKAQQEWLLETGDLLYLPPGYAHFGVAEGDCITYSIGFRAPSIRESLSSFVDFLSQKPGADQRFCDQDIQLNLNIGEITQRELDHFQSWLLQLANDRSQFELWFGQEMTRNKYAGPDDDEPPALTPPEIDDLLAELVARQLIKTLDTRWAYIDAEGYTHLFVDGRQWQVSTPLAHLLCSQAEVAGDAICAQLLTESDQRVVAELLALTLLTDVEEGQ